MHGLLLLLLLQAAGVMHVRRRVGRRSREPRVLLHGCRKRGGNAALFYAPAGTRVHDRGHPGHRTHAGGPPVVVHGADAGVQRRVREPARTVGDHRDHGHDTLRGNRVVHLGWSRTEGEAGRDNSSSNSNKGIQAVSRSDKTGQDSDPRYRRHAGKERRVRAAERGFLCPCSFDNVSSHKHQTPAPGEITQKASGWSGTCTFTKAII